ncbi:MAG: thioredoxin family protein [Saprospiraceae bacterium]
MKVIFPFLSLYFFVSILTAQTLVTAGIQFEEGSWKKALTKAKEENKLIFLDAYTDWCRPCKRMDREVFANRKVGRFYNENFVNYKMNMEAGSGIPVGIEYNIKSYPAFLFIDGDGKMHHRIVSYQSVPQFMEVGEIALDEERNLAGMEARYAKGERSAEFLYNYAIMRFQAGDNSHLPIAEEYLDTQTDVTTEKNLDFVFNYLDNTDSKIFDLLIKHRPAFVQKFGTPAVVGKIQNLIYDKLNDTVNRSSLEQIDALFKRAYPDKANEMSTRFRLTYYSQAEDSEKYIENAKLFMKNYEPRDVDELNEMAWNFYELATERKDLKLAAKWAKSAVAMDNSLFTNDTLAALYHRLGKKGKAIKTAEAAIQIARKNGQDYSETQRLLDEIRKS